MSSLSIAKPWLADNGLRVASRSCNSVLLIWAAQPDTFLEGHSQESLDSNTTSGHDLDENESNYGLQNRHSYEVQMKPSKWDKWTTIYKGFNTTWEVEDLMPDVTFSFRLRVTGEKWGSVVDAATEASPPCAEDLHRAVHCNAEDMVLRIIVALRPAQLKKIIDSHDRAGLTSLMLAAQNGNHHIIEILMKAGADINATSRSSQKNSLMYAVGSGHLGATKCLDRFGVSWNHKDKTGSNVLHYAVTNGCIKILAYVFERSGKVLLEDRDDSGWTPLMKASNSAEVVKMLLKHGANPVARDNSNSKSCLMAAELLGKSAMVKLLTQYSAEGD